MNPRERLLAVLHGEVPDCVPACPDTSNMIPALFVELSLEEAEVVFSDNYFDIPAGMAVQVTAPLPSNWTLEKARQALRVRSMIDI